MEAPVRCTIAPKSDSEKSRAFSALCTAYVTADRLWDLGASDKHDRPIYATFAASEGEIRPFIANLLCGRIAVPESDSTYRRRRGQEAGLEFMRSAGYKVAYQRFEQGTLATIYLPDFFMHDPGMVDPAKVSFVCLPGSAYLESQAQRLDIDRMVRYARLLPRVKKVNRKPEWWDRHEGKKPYEGPLEDARLTALAPLSYLFCLYLSNRSRAPMPPDGRFYLQVLLACLGEGLASFSTTEYGARSEGFGLYKSFGFAEEVSQEAQLAPGIALHTKHQDLEDLLASECAEYFERI